MADDGPKRREDDCDMVTSLQAAELSKNERCLHEAARKNQVEVIKTIIERRAANINCKNNLDRTALHMAASQGHVEAVDMLIKGKAVVDTPDKYGMTPLLWAAFFSHTPVVTHLAEKGGSMKKVNKQGLGVVHLAAEKNCIELLDYVLLKHKRIKLDEVDNNGMTPVLTSVTNNSIDVLKKLVDKECSLLTEDKTQRNVLHLASKSGHVEILRYLLTFPALVELIDNKDGEHKNSLHYACELGHVGAVKVLLEKHVNIEIETERSTTPLMIATQHSHLEIIRLLVAAGANINAQSDQGNTCLHIAAVNNQAEVCSVLIELGCEIDLPNNRLQTPLHTSIEQNKPDTTEVLLLAGANLETIDKTGKSPLLLATRGSYISLIDMLIKSSRYRQRKELRRAITASTANLNGTLHEGGPNTFTPHDYTNSYNINEERDPEELDEDDNPGVVNGDHGIDVVDYKQSGSSLHRGVDGSMQSASNDGPFRLKEFNQVYAEEFKMFLWKLAFNHLRTGEWKKLAEFWNFDNDHMTAIEHQDSGERSYKQHGYRMLCIWFHGIDATSSPMKELYEALVAIDRRDLADKIRSELDADISRIRHKESKRCSLM